jgi:Fic family protein
MTFGNLILLIIAVLGVALGYFMSQHDVRDRAFDFVNSERHIEKERRKRMLLKHLKDRKRITNDEAEQLLGVTHSSATRYFDELEAIGAIVQKGEGRGVYYELATKPSEE